MGAGHHVEPEQLGEPQSLSGGTTAVVIGVLGALYGGLGVAQALQHAMNTAWNVPRNNRPNPFLARGKSLVLLATAGVAVIESFAQALRVCVPVAAVKP